MGVFDLFSKGFNQRSKLTHVKLVEPSVGRIVELQVTEQDDCVAKYYMGLLTAYGEGLEQLVYSGKSPTKQFDLHLLTAIWLRMHDRYGNNHSYSSEKS